MVNISEKTKRNTKRVRNEISTLDLNSGGFDFPDGKFYNRALENNWRNSTKSKRR